MITSPIAATDDMFQSVKDKIPALETYLGYSIDVRWQGIEKAVAPDITKVWLRVLKKELDEDKTYVSNASNTFQMFTHVGILSIEVFGPTADLLSWEKINYCADEIKKNFKRQSPLGVKFTKCVVIEAPVEIKWYKLNVVINYEYDEQRTV